MAWMESCSFDSELNLEMLVSRKARSLWEHLVCGVGRSPRLLGSNAMQKLCSDGI
jgi:hypothetical protein